MGEKSTIKKEANEKRLPKGKELRTLVREYTEHRFDGMSEDVNLQIIQTSETFAYKLIIWLKEKGY